MMITFGSSETGEVGPTFGPLPHVQITFDTIRAGDRADGDAYTIAVLRHPTGLWQIVDPEHPVHAYLNGQRIDADPSAWLSVLGTEWTDATVHASADEYVR